MVTALTESLIRMSGLPVTNAAGQEYHAYLQQIKPRGTDRPTPLGEETDARYLYIGPHEYALTPGGRLDFARGSFRVEKEKMVCFLGNPAYRWAELIPLRGD